MGPFDAIAIGGGLAGAAFALELRRHGVSVAIIERARAPHHKVCGDFHSREAQELLARLGIDVARLGAARVSTLRLAAGRRAATAPLPFPAIGLSRFTLDEALLRAAGDAGAEILRGESVAGLEPDGGHVVVRAGRRVLRARSVALATGKHNVRGWPRARASMTAFKIQLVPTPAAQRQLSDVVQLAGYRGGYIGACLVEDGSATICWLADEDFMNKTAGDWSRQLASISRQSPFLGDLLAGSKFVAAEPAAIAAIPFGYERQETIAPNVYPVGDQLAVIPSITGDGTSLALASGLRAARAIVAGEAADAYQRASLARTRAQFRWARTVHSISRNRPMRALGLGAVALAPRLASLLAELTRTRDIDSLLT